MLLLAGLPAARGRCQRAGASRVRAWCSQFTEQRSSMLAHVLYWPAPNRRCQQEQHVGMSAPTQVRASHLLVKHAGSRRPSSWKEERVTRSQEEALQMVKSFRWAVGGLWSGGAQWSVHSEPAYQAGCPRLQLPWAGWWLP